MLAGVLGGGPSFHSPQSQGNLRFSCPNATLWLPLTPRGVKHPEHWEIGSCPAPRPTLHNVCLSRCSVRHGASAFFLPAVVSSRSVTATIPVSGCVFWTPAVLTIRCRGHCILRCLFLFFSQKLEEEAGDEEVSAIK